MEQNIKQLLIERRYKIQKIIALSTTSFHDESVVGEVALSFVKENFESIVFKLH